MAWGRGWEGSVMCAILGCTAQVCLLAAVLCGSAAIVCPFPMPDFRILELCKLDNDSYMRAGVELLEHRLRQLYRLKE